MSELKDILLETVSFFKAMNVEQILREMDPLKIDQMPQLTMEDLEKELKKLKRSGHMIAKGKGKDRTWQRVNPRHLSFFKRLYHRFL